MGRIVNSIERKSVTSHRRPVNPLMKVTALRVQARNKNRVNVYLDGKFAFGLVKLEAARLRIGQELDEAAIARLRSADNREQVHERALRLIARRARSEAEVRDNLKKHGVPPELIEAEIARLRESGLLNDDTFARLWVENRAAFRPRSKRALQVELKRKGVPPAAMQAALAEVDDTDAAYRLATQRARRLANLPREEFRQKLAGFLARRGFNYDTIGPLVERTWRELKAED
jgi:regulatory protein